MWLGPALEANPGLIKSLRVCLGVAGRGLTTILPPISAQLEPLCFPDLNFMIPPLEGAGIEAGKGEECEALVAVGVFAISALKWVEEALNWVKRREKKNE